MDWTEYWNSGLDSFFILIIYHVVVSLLCLHLPKLLALLHIYNSVTVIRCNYNYVCIYDYLRHACAY